MNSVYTNEMRHAIRAIKNPAPIYFDVAQKDGMLFILVKKELFQGLTDKQKRDFRAYIRQVKSILELGGATVLVAGTE